MRPAQVNGISNVARDIVTGRITEGSLQTQISIRGETIILGYSNTATMRGFEVSYSPKALGQLIELLMKTATVVQGRGS